jgi:hypothetical protein
MNMSLLDGISSGKSVAERMNDVRVPLELDQNETGNAFVHPTFIV